MKRFTIALSGLSGEDAALVRDELDKHHAHDWDLVEGTSAFLLLVDIDSTWGHMDWLRATANKQHVAACTVNDQVRDADLILRKPIKREDVAQLLHRLEELAERRGQSGAATKAAHKPEPPRAAPAQTESPRPVEPVAVAAAAPMPETTIVPESVPEPEPVREPEPEEPPMTLGEALLAGRIDQPLYFKSEDAELCLDPERGGYVGPAKLKPLHPLLDRMLDTAIQMDDAAITRMREAPALPLTRLLWFAALVAAPGQLDSRLDPQNTFRLGRWPQIEREFPRHFRIATSMMKQPGTLESIAQAASAPTADVADFINAYYVAGYVEVIQPVNAEAEAQAGSGKGMLRRLRKSFARNSDGEDEAAQPGESLPPEA